MSENIKKSRTKISFGLIFAGLVFFFNPCINLFDVFPDMFGALLIYAGLRKQAAVDGYFEDARKISLYLVFLYIAKFLFSFSVLSNPNNSLPYTFIFSVLELIFLIPFFHKLFAGFEYTLMRCSDDNQKLKTNEPYAFSMIFIAVKCVGVVLVELFELLTQGADYDLSANAAYYASLADAKKYATVLCFFIQLILGIIFIYQMAKFFKSIKKHPYYYKELSEKYAEELVLNNSKHINKTLSVSCNLMLISVVFAADVFLEGIDVLPDVFTAVFVIAALAVMTYAGDYIKLPRMCCLLMAFAGIVSTAFSVYVNPERFYIQAKQYPFVENYSDGFYNGVQSAYITAVISALFAAAFIYAVICFVKCNRKVYEKELMGNHDRKLLTVGVFSSCTVLLKGLTAVVEAVIARIATDPLVSDFISDRPVLTEARMNERMSENLNIARLVQLENVAFVLSFLTVVLVVFTVFNIFALKAESVKEEV